MNHRVLTLCVIVSVLLGVYMVNGEKMVKQSSLYSRDNERITRSVNDRVKRDTYKRTPPPKTVSSSISQSAISLFDFPCPDPFLPDPSPSIKRPTCSHGCCLPCPYANNFYPRNSIDTIYTVLSIFRVISFVCVLVILISYLVLPNKREPQAITVLCLNTTLLMFLTVTFFYMGDHRKVQCVDEYTQADMTNNLLCEVQGIILIFSTFALILYCFLLIIQLHLQTVWRCNIIQRHYAIAQSLVLIISLVFTILPVITRQISFEFGAVCLVSMETINQYFWFPLAVIVLPGFIIHIWTFTYIAKSQCLMNDDFDFEDSLCESSTTTSTVVQSITNVTTKEVFNSIKVQWRALVLSMIFLITFIIYWIFIYVAKTKLWPLLHHSETTSWINKWTTCILNNSSIDAQDYCYSTLSKYYVPSLAFLWVAESLTATLGISMFVVFGTSINLWSEWRVWFRNRYGGVVS